LLILARRPPVRDRIATAALRVAWSFAGARLVAPRSTAIVLYHDVPTAPTAPLSRAVFERHLLFLKQHFQLVGPDQVDRKRHARERANVLLTFDDGFRNHAEVVAPLLRKHRVPAIFFVSSRHASPGKYLWFSYLKALEKHFPWKGFSFCGEYFDMGGLRQASIKRLSTALLNMEPHPSGMYEAIERELPPLADFVSARELADTYAGMTAEHVGELAADPLFSIGVHTVDHPFLTKSAPTEALRQIQENRTWIESASGRPCDLIAYPSGDYNADLLEMCEQAGFRRGYAVSRRIGRTSALELSRIGVYSDSLDVLGFKVQWGALLRTMRIPIG
jgi:peptidoglycan/xylan/chitin deacetylase (PgdA/CDA1 family)